MPFDLASAKPVDEPSFDLSTAKPVEITGELPSDKYAREHGIKLPIEISSNLPRQIATEGLRIVGKAGRDIAQGALALPAELLDAPETIFNAGAELLGSNMRLPRIFHSAVAALDSPVIASRTPTERVVSGIGQSVSGAAGGIGFGKALANSTDTVVSNVGAQLAARPTLQLASATTGALSSGVTRELGGGPVAQLAAGFAGSLAPPLAETAGQALVRAIARGGEAGRRTVERNLKTFEDAGTTPSVGQATENRRAQATESLLSKTPGGAGVMADKAIAQANEMGDFLDAQARALAPKAGAMTAGRAIESGISGDQGFRAQFTAKADKLYSKLDQYLPSDTPIDLKNTTTTLQKIVAPIAGAEETSKLLTNAKITAIDEALQGDLAKAANGQLPYQAVKELRSKIGALTANSSLVPDAPTAELKQIYGALSEDMNAAATGASPEAARAAARANDYWRAGMDRLETIQSVIDRNGGPERIFTAATSGLKDGDSTLRAVMQSLGPDEQKVVTATVLRRMGIANPSAQDAQGSAFSTETFLTNWNKLSDEAKRTLFYRNGYPKEFGNNMDQIASVAANLRSGSQVFANPSGTGQTLGLVSAASAFFGSLFSGHPLVAAGVAGSVGGANLSARLMTNPEFVQWLARSTKAPITAAPSLINVLAQKGKSSGDPDLIAAADALKAAQ